MSNAGTPFSGTQLPVASPSTPIANAFSPEAQVRGINVAQEGPSSNASTPTQAQQSPNGTGDELSKPKQKRNKPTLSCEECVERKTKVSATVCRKA